MIFSGDGRPVRPSGPGEPWVALSVLGCVIGVKVDEAALDLPVADLEDVAPSASAPLGDPGPPGSVTVLTVAGALAHHDVGGEHPVEVGVMMDDRGDRAADIGKQLADALLARRQSPFGEVDLRIVGEQVQDAAAGRGDTAVIERLQVLQRDRLALLIGHRLSGQCHRATTVLARGNSRHPGRLRQHTSEADLLTALPRSPASRTGYAA